MRLVPALLSVLLALPTVAPAADRTVSIAAAERQVIERSNAFRQSQSLAPLAPDATLTASAQAFAAYMARTDRYGHEADGRKPSERAQAHGYAYCMVAENIAMLYSSAGYETGELAAKYMQGWIDSPGHRKNLLAAEATDIGVAIAQSASSGRYYAVQLFGRPARLLLKFSLYNRSREPLRYQLDDQSYALPSGMTRSHEQCTAPALSLTLPGSAETVTLQPVNGTQYRFEPAGRGVKVVEAR
jgi:uncharacterized protein YkwD